MNARILGLVALSLSVLTATQAQTTVGAWSMGDDDIGATNGAAVDGTLTASVGQDLSLIGSGLTYTNNIAPQSSGTLAVNFDGNGRYGVSSNLGLSTNFAMETWVNFSDVSASQWLMLVGNGGSSGTGLLFDQGTGEVKIALSGVNLFAGTPVLSTNTWYHIAMVVDDNGTASMYFNGSLVSGTVNVGSFASNFSLGGDEGGNALLMGTLDDAKVITFAAGTFNASMLDYAAVPEPATYAALAGLLALGVAAWRRRRTAE